MLVAQVKTPVGTGEHVQSSIFSHFSLKIRHLLDMAMGTFISFSLWPVNFNSFVYAVGDCWCAWAITALTMEAKGRRQGQRHLLRGTYYGINSSSFSVDQPLPLNVRGKCQHSFLDCVTAKGRGREKQIKEHRFFLMRGLMCMSVLSNGGKNNFFFCLMLLYKSIVP